MKHYIGLDVSVRSTSLCIVDGDGRIVQERKLPTESATIAAHLASTGLYIERIGLEAGVMSQHLYSGLAEAELPVVCVPTHEGSTVRSAQQDRSPRRAGHRADDP